MMQTDLWPNKEIVQKPRAYVNMNKESQPPILSYDRTRVVWKILMHIYT